MKKRFMNEHFMFGFFVVFVFVFLWCINLYCYYDKSKTLVSIIIVHCVVGGFCFASVFSALLLFEIIEINEKEIKSKKIFRSTVTIFISDIQNIQEVDIGRAFVLGTQTAWEIKDLQGKVINIIKGKRREKLIEQIKEKANLT